MHWTEIADVCPITTKFFKETMPLDQYLRVRFMLLEPGGYILPHRDNNKNQLQAFNFALNNPKDCFFGIENHGNIPWKAGDSRIINISTNHAVWNNSNVPRIHMIAHGWAKNNYQSYRDCLIRSYKKLCESYM
jgi:aspartyl/asparaginyl beta-hydroxylase (cupin superfamily)